MHELSWSQRTLSIGELAVRSGVSTSALRFYEERGLIHSERNAANRRQYRRDVLRRIAFIRIASQVGITLTEIGAALDRLPAGRTPSRADWTRLSEAWQDELEMRIHRLEQLRDAFSDCVGCGCLSIDRCKLANPYDALAQEGAGPRRLIDDGHPLGDEDSL